MASFSDINAIANTSDFQGRCMYALYVASVNVMGEDNGTAHHATRVSYATTVLRGAIAPVTVALVTLTNPTIAAEADITQAGGGFAIPDSDIQFTVNSDFNGLAGIGT